MNAPTLVRDPFNVLTAIRALHTPPTFSSTFAHIRHARTSNARTAQRSLSCTPTSRGTSEPMVVVFRCLALVAKVKMALL